LHRIWFFHLVFLSNSFILTSRAGRASIADGGEIGLNLPETSGRASATTGMGHVRPIPVSPGA
jgi:hypothetical protein